MVAAAIAPRTAERVLYLTFDDGPSQYTAALLKVPRNHKATATFFVTGRAAQSRPSLIRQIHRRGHSTGNHTRSHPRLTQVVTSQVRNELNSTGKTVGPAIGPCMRPPYGMVDRRVARASISLGFQPGMWTSHIEDWSPHTLAWTVRRLDQETKPGAVILMHDTHAQTVAAVKAMLPRWAERGYRFEAVPACEGTASRHFGAVAHASLEGDDPPPPGPRP